MTETAAAVLVARRELKLLARSRATLGAAFLLAAVAWLPVILPPLRRGSLGVASFEEMLPLLLALAAVILPLLALLAGAELFAGELEDGSLVPVLTLPVSRRACFAGKCLGRAGALATAYVATFAAAGLTVAASRGAAGWRDWAAVAGGGLLVSLSCGGLGAVLGCGGSGRVRAFAAALVGWIVLVFALDAALLTVIVALAPPPPQAVGEHGHGELAAPRREGPIRDPHAREAEPEAEEGHPSVGLLALSPVSLFRLTSLAASPGLRPRLALGLPAAATAGLWSALLAGWSLWLAAPLVLGLRRFRRADL